MNNEIKEIFNNFKEHLEKNYQSYLGGAVDSTEYYMSCGDLKLLLDYITNLQEENKKLNNNQVKALNRIKDFINSSKCEIKEGYYSNDNHSLYWKIFRKFAEELQKKIKGIDTTDYVYIPKWREEELLNKEERIDKAIELINKALNTNSDYVEYEFGTELLRQELLDILEGKE